MKKKFKISWEGAVHPLLPVPYTGTGSLVVEAIGLLPNLSRYLTLPYLLT